VGTRTTAGVGGAIHLMENDKNFNKFRKDASDAFRGGAPQYQDLVTFGGHRGSLIGLIVPMRSSVKTIKATVNELTWMVRNVTIVATPAGEGHMNIEFIDEYFDLVPGDRSDSYNVITTILGGIYHGAMGNSGPAVNVNWTTSLR